MKYFISGHREITQDEFNTYYIPKINTVLKSDSNAQFVIGDYWGVDEMSQNYLDSISQINKVTVYHMLVSPRYYNKNVTRFKGGYKTDEERDAAMTKDSDFDIAFVRDSKWKTSGTAQNIKRRITFN